MRYFSAERGQWEELPETLVDWAATEQMGQRSRARVPRRPLSRPPLLPRQLSLRRRRSIKEEQACSGRVHLMSLLVCGSPIEDGVWALDTFHDQPELVSLAQNTGDVAGPE